MNRLAWVGLMYCIVIVCTLGIAGYWFMHDDLTLMQVAKHLWVATLAWVACGVAGQYLVWIATEDDG